MVGQHFLGRSRGQHFRNGGWGWGDEPLEGTVLRSSYLLTFSFQSFDELPSPSIRFSLSFFTFFFFFTGFSFEMQSHLSCFSSATHVSCTRDVLTCTCPALSALTAASVATLFSLVGCCTWMIAGADIQLDGPQKDTGESKQAVHVGARNQL